jgi:hypothetical protein
VGLGSERGAQIFPRKYNYASPTVTRHPWPTTLPSLVLLQYRMMETVQNPSNSEFTHLSVRPSTFLPNGAS